MDNSKYIMVDYQGINTPILFPSFVVHSDIAKVFGGKDKVLSAGFFEVGAKPDKDDTDNISVCVFGKSTTVGKEVDKENDPFYIRKLLRKQGF
jgi:hypothetical protein